MKSILLIFAFLLTCLPAGADLGVKLRYSPVANLVYQLDCISGALPHCSRSTFQELWKKEVIKTDSDEVLIKSWAELMARYRGGIEIKDGSKDSTSGRTDSVQLSTKIRIASFQSEKIEDYFQRLDLIITPNDRHKFEKVIRHFNPAFSKWWKKTALPQGTRFTKETESLLKKPSIAKKLKQFAHFYQADLPENYSVFFNLFYRPNSEEPTSGQQIENYSVAEFIPDEKPIDRIDVIIHELCHFFYRSSTDEHFSAFQKSFESQARVESRAAFNLFNEIMATALGNGLINKLNMEKGRWEKYSKKSQSFYHNFHIDKGAKAILPWLEDWLNQGRTLYDPEFVAKYVATLEKDFGAELTAPRILLNELVFVTDSKFEGKLRDSARKSMRASSMYSSEGTWDDERTLKSYKELPTLSALILIHPSNIKYLESAKILNSSDFNAFKKILKAKGQAVFSFHRNANVPAYIISAPNADDAQKLIERLADSKAGFTGALEI